MCLVDKVRQMRYLLDGDIVDVCGRMYADVGRAFMFMSGGWIVFIANVVPSGENDEERDLNTATDKRHKSKQNETNIKTFIFPQGPHTMYTAASEDMPRQHIV